MNAVLEELGKTGIVPVIKIDDAEKALPLAQALVEGGIPCAEVTFRTAAGGEAMRRINEGLGDKILLGAGTVLTTEQVDKAIDAGAKFIVSPGFNPKVVSYCLSKGVAVTPGCSSPSDMEAALEMGLEVVKFFPAEPSGGLAYIKAVAAPYPSLKFMPTGGISAANIATYLAYDRILACGGSWMVTAELINSGNYAGITALCKEAIRQVHGFTVVHLGINAANDGDAKAAAALFDKLFGFPLKEGNSSIFASDGIEIMKSGGLGKYGHIGIGANSLARAKAYFERAGVAFNQESIKTDAKGSVTVVYFKEEIAGFAVHLVQKK